MPKQAKTEVEAYDYIRRQLRELRWVVRNPSTKHDGQVWTQNQCLSHPEIKRALGLERPENIVKLSERQLWVIEAKANRNALQTAIHEAIHKYSEPINESSGNLQVLLATGIAGDEDSGYVARTLIRRGGEWRTVTINGHEATGLLSPQDVSALRANQSSDIHEFAPPQWTFLQAAERINGILHAGGINKNDRAKTIAALLLAVIGEPPNLDTTLPILIREINARSEDLLREKGKQDFARFVEILPPTNTTNHVKFKGALVKTIQELLNLNIRSAMNSSTDVLGQFYEVFLKYGNGAKEIGIVLTPRHITKFAVEAVGVGPQDIVLDPACGTGGFLVAAFDYVRRTCSPEQVDRFKRHNLFGIEQESYIAILAIVNMIFRGDGRHNIVEGNCFSMGLKGTNVGGVQTASFTTAAVSRGNEPITRVLMNPPFALAHEVEQERLFVSRALQLMADGGNLFSLLPMDCMFGAHDDLQWRKTELLAHNTLLAVLSFPPELFYPAASKQVIGIIVRKGFPHPREQSVFWARIARDGHLKVKRKRIAATDLVPPREEPNDIPRVLPQLRAFLANPDTTDVNET